MQKRVIIVHGWGGYAEECWFPWLRRELVERGYVVFVPPMPDPDHPLMRLWIDHLSEVTGHCDEHTYFVGHSLGCQTILRYLQEQSPAIRIGGALLVAGFEHLSAKANEPEHYKVLEPWLKNPIHWETIRGRSDHFTAIFSDNDEWVPLSNVEVFAKKLGAETVVLHGKDHFSGRSGITELPEALDALLAMTGE